MDETTFAVLDKMNLKNVSLIRSSEFENERLLAAKKERTVAEYSWTCTANLCWYLLGKIKDGETITYLDADMAFFSDPEAIFQEMADASIAIVGHRLEGERKTMEKYVGKYNVAWVSFKKDEQGMKASEWWKERVLEWCFARFEGGKIGDQHYLNDWTERFKNVHVVSHEGADVAPWNVANRKITARDGKMYIGSAELVFYHFHSFTLVHEHFYLPAPAYYIPRSAQRYIYDVYFKEMQQNIAAVSKVDPVFHFGFKKNYLKSYIAQKVFSCRFIEYFYIKYCHYNLKRSHG